MNFIPLNSLFPTLKMTTLSWCASSTQTWRGACFFFRFRAYLSISWQVCLRTSLLSGSISERMGYKSSKIILVLNVSHLNRGEFSRSETTSKIISSTFHFKNCLVFLLYIRMIEMSIFCQAKFIIYEQDASIFLWIDYVPFENIYTRSSKKSIQPDFDAFATIATIEWGKKRVRCHDVLLRIQKFIETAANYALIWWSLCKAKRFWIRSGQKCGQQPSRWNVRKLLHR